MCANYIPPRSEALAQFDLGPTDISFTECYPGSIAPFLSSAKPDAWLPGTFGLMPSWAEPKLAKMTYNARSETVAQKPSFRNAWRNRQLAVIPVQSFFEPNYESGKAVRWRIERADKKPFGIAGLWESKNDQGGKLTWSFTMLTINADGHPLMQRFHKPDDEKRSVVVLPDEAWGAWMGASTDAEVLSYLMPVDPELFRTEADPKVSKNVVELNRELF